MGNCLAEAPSIDLYRFVGKLRVGGKNFPLDANQLLLKGAVLKNTSWVMACAVYTGVDTRLMMNSQESR